MLHIQKLLTLRFTFDKRNVIEVAVIIFLFFVIETRHTGVIRGEQNRKTLSQNGQKKIRIVRAKKS